MEYKEIDDVMYVSGNYTKKNDTNFPISSCALIVLGVAVFIGVLAWAHLAGMTLQ